MGSVGQRPQRPPRRESEDGADDDGEQPPRAETHVLTGDAAQGSAQRLVPHRDDRPDPVRVAQEGAEVGGGLGAEHEQAHQDRPRKDDGGEHRLTPAPLREEVQPGDRGRELDAGEHTDETPRQPPPRTAHREHHAEDEEDVDLPVVECGANRFGPDPRGRPHHRGTGPRPVPRRRGSAVLVDITVAHDEFESDPHDGEERSDRQQLPCHAQDTERDQVQGQEDERGEGRIGERQREVGGVLRIGESVEVPLQQGGRSVDVDVQVDEVHPVGRDECPGQTDDDRQRQ